ncbi:hypothetical protein Rin_00006400 [Candidatus Regiella insecticola 5.15]|uniref:Uncharacterized protein n=1 Tax=Candidatus Regiella insecticola 5.15 TaxID=1005043 RepID=G2GXZ3_9ENTR|nr:hypothetical protein [Candidatus Regiella insecticola]EGY29390.1 hypothetical protein Rin_00006400 [Candidatus Regiella insecticola 5.15]
MFPDFPNSTLLFQDSNTLAPDVTLYRIPPEIATAGVVITLGAILLSVRNVARHITPQNVVPLANTFANSLMITGVSLAALQAPGSNWQNLPYHLPTGALFSLLMSLVGLGIYDNHNPAPFQPPFP